MQRRNHSVNTLTIGEFVAIHMMVVVVKNGEPMDTLTSHAPASVTMQAKRAMELADALLAEFESKEQSK